MSRFTIDATPAGEHRVGSDLRRIVEAVRGKSGADDLLVVYLLGGYARGEGTVVAGPDGHPRGFNDYDLLLVFAEEPRDRGVYARLAEILAGELEIDFVDLGVATLKQIRNAPPTLFWYELGEAHRCLWRKTDVSVDLPHIRMDAINPDEATRLLFNRGMALLWAGLRLWPEGVPGVGGYAGDPAELRFATIAAHKAVLAAGDASLLSEAAYALAQVDRERTLKTISEHLPWADPGFQTAYAAAAEFRRRPQIPDADEIAGVWWRGREYLEKSLGHIEQRRLGFVLNSWETYAERLRSHVVREGWRKPKTLVRSVERSLQGKGWLEADMQRLVHMIEFLFLPVVGGTLSAPSGEVWRHGALRLVRSWHP